MSDAWNIFDPNAPDPIREHQLEINRRQFFGRTAGGIGTAALASLLGRDGIAADVPPRRTGLPGVPHHGAKAKNVIYLFQNGGPTHVDIFDYKPNLTKLHGKPFPNGYVEGKRFSTMTGKARAI